jgi:dTDP-L-rhamnose 4-epimerase
MKVLITGGAGFIGKWLVRTLPSDAEIVIVDSIDPQVHRSSSDFSEELKSRAHCIKADINDRQAYAADAEGTDVVVHLASQTGTGQSMYEISRYAQQNVEGTATLLEVISSLSQKPKRIVLTSSRAVYGDGVAADTSGDLHNTSRSLENLQAGKWEVYNHSGEALTVLPMHESHIPHPTSVYGLTKLWQEQLIENYCKTQDIDYAIFRLQNVYGPEQELRNPYTGIIGIFTSLIMQKGAVELFEDGQMTRDFVYVRDVAQALINSIHFQGRLAKVLNVGSGVATSLESLVHTISAVAQKPVEVTYSGRFRVGDIRHAVADMNAYDRTFKWLPTSLDEGIKSYLDWYASQKPLSDEALSASFKEMEKEKLLLNSR